MVANKKHVVIDGRASGRINNTDLSTDRKGKGCAPYACIVASTIRQLNKQSTIDLLASPRTIVSSFCKLDPSVQYDRLRPIAWVCASLLSAALSGVRT